jgi:serpin B
MHMHRLTVPLFALVIAAVAYGTLESAAEESRGPRLCDFPTRPGTYEAGEWEYTYAIESPGSRSETRIGALKQAGKAVAGKKDEVLDTPLGRFKFHDARYNKGWLNTLTFDTPVFKEDTDRAAVVKGNTEFALDLYARLAKQDGNLFFSPYSISDALAMTSAGARGETLAQMTKVLHLPDQERLHPAFSELIRSLNGHGLPRDYELTVVNALWGQRNYNFLPEFQQTIRTNYGAGIRKVDFKGATEEARQTINKWVEGQTHDKVKDLLKPDILNVNTRLVLTNAVYFKASWYSPFFEEQTKPKDFLLAGGKKATVPMMHQTAPFRYFENDAVQALELPYEGKDLSMVVLLPRKEDGLAGLEKALTPATLTAWLGGLADSVVAVSLPKFKVTAALDLKPTLAEMGMPDAFDFVKADFSGLNGKRDLAITAVVHKGFADVNEKGTEATAATAVVVGRRGGPEPVVFRADHPFVFLIRDNHTGTVLFLGRLTEPASGK